MNQTLQEYVDSRGLQMQIDRAVSVIQGVKVLGLDSRNKRRYLPAALRAAIPLYEGAKVNINHAKGQPCAPRDYQDRIGTIRNVRFLDDAGLFADLQFNPKHALAEQLVWDAQHAPENVGLSHNVQALTKVDNGYTIVESIAAVHSVDLVADPATTQGLFEECTPDDAGASIPWSDLTVESLQARRPDLITQLLQPQLQTCAELQEQLHEARTLATQSQRRMLIGRLLNEVGLPAQPSGDGVITPRFLESLLSAPDDTTLRELIADRAALVRDARWWHGLLPAQTAHARSREQLAVDAPPRITTTEEFVRAIT